MGFNISGRINRIYGKYVRPGSKDPWTYIKKMQTEGTDGSGTEIRRLSKGVFEILQVAGITACVIFIIIMAMIYAVSRSPDKRAEAKSGMVQKMVILAVIFGALTILSNIVVIIARLL